MAVHFLSSGDLVTRSGSTWRFGVAPGLQLGENERIDWLYGTHTSERTDEAGVTTRMTEGDSDENPRGPETWIPAGSGLLSQPIAFPHARPYTVIAVYVRFDAVRRLETRTAFNRADLEVVRRAPSGGGIDLSGALEGPATRGSVGEGETLSTGDGPFGRVGSTVERGDDDEDGPPWDDTGVFTVADDDPSGSCVVYPGKLVIEKVPAVIAHGTKGFLPVLIHLYGLSSKVRLTGYGGTDKVPAVRYLLSARGSKARLVSETTPRFTLSNGTVDSPHTLQRNGEGAQYIYYLSPEVLQGLGRLAEGSIIKQVFMRAFLYAKPVRPRSSSPVRLTEKSTDIRYYLDDRTYLQHFDTYDKWSRYAMSAGGSSGAGPARRYVHALSADGKRMKAHPVSDNRRQRFPGLTITQMELVDQSGALGADLRVAAKAIHGNLTLEQLAIGPNPPPGPNAGGVGALLDKIPGVALTIRAAEALAGRLADPVGYLAYEVEGARRGALVFPYYRLASSAPLVLGKGARRCMIGKNVGDSGSFRLRLHTQSPNGMASIAGLADDSDLFDYPGLVSSAAAGLGALAALASLPLSAAALGVVAGIAGVLWASTPVPAGKQTTAEVHVESGLRIRGYEDTTARLDRPRARQPRTRTTNGAAALDVSGSWDSVHLTVGEAVNVFQVVNLALRHRAIGAVTLEAQFTKDGYDKALEVAAA